MSGPRRLSRALGVTAARGGICRTGAESAAMLVELVCDVLR